MMEHAPCGACGADEAFLLFTSPDTRNPGSGEVFPVGRCRRCGHVYVLERPTASEIGRYYPASYEEHRRTERPSPRKHSKRHRRIRLRRGERVLDIGCGSGYDLLRLRQRGCELFGVELGAQAATNARANGITVFEGSAEQADFPDAHFHQVTMNHCLEHFHDPGAALRNARRMTRPDGLIYLTFPTAEGANFRLFGADWYHLDVPRHLHFFTHGSFARLARGCGLRIVYRACTSGTRGFRHSIEARGGRSALLGVASWLINAKPLSLVMKEALRLVDGLRQGDIAEYLLRPEPDFGSPAGSPPRTPALGDFPKAPGVPSISGGRPL